MSLSQFKPFKLVLVLRRFDLMPNIRERNPGVKRDPTLLICVTAVGSNLNKTISTNLHEFDYKII